MDSDGQAPRNQYARLLHATPGKSGVEPVKLEPIQLVARSTPVLPRAELTEIEREIVIQLQRNGRLSFAQIARVTDMSEKAVRTIVAKLEENKIIHITALTFPDLLGFKGAATCAIKLAPGASARKIARQLGKMDFVSYVAVTLGSVDIWADLVCKDRATLLAMLDEKVRTLDGIQSLEVFLYVNVTRYSMGGAGLSRPSENVPSLNLDEIDRKIFGQLALNGRQPYIEIAQHLGVSESSVRQRVKRAMDAGIFSINALVNPGSLGGEVLAWVAVRTSRGQGPELAAALACWPLASYIGVTLGRFDLFVEFICRDKRELLSELTALRNHELVEAIEPFVYVDLQVKAITFA